MEIVSVTVYCYSALLAMEKLLKMECIASKKKKKDSWGSAGNESGNKWKICDVGIEEWKPNVICSIIQRTNNERHRSESWELDTGRVYF